MLSNYKQHVDIYHKTIGHVSNFQPLPSPRAYSGKKANHFTKFNKHGAFQILSTWAAFECAKALKTLIYRRSKDTYMAIDLRVHIVL